jgi:hypothetical protein
VAFAQVELGALGGGGFGTIPSGVVLGQIGVVDLPSILPFLLESAAAYAVSQDLSLPAGAVVTKASFTVAAGPPEHATPAGDIGTVRASSGPPAEPSDELVLDFGVLRTVSSVEAPVAISSIRGWLGTQFDMDIVSGKNSAYLEFTEVQTERLLVTTASQVSVSPASFAQDATVTTTTPPADLELLVGGTRAWNLAGPVPEGFSQDVDVTTALQAAVDGGTPDDDGLIAVPVLLRARIPGTLSLGLTEPLSYLRTYAVQFPGPANRTFAEEGRLAVDLPLPADASGWIVHRVLATVTATDDDPQRVQPPVGPDPTAAAELVLDPDRRIVVHVPSASLDVFERLVGVRVSVQPLAGGVELSGALFEDGETSNPLEPVPGDPVPKGTFTPVTLDEAAEPAFVTLALPQPLKLVSGTPLWFSLAATRGSAVVGLAAPAQPTPDDELAVSPELRRVMPNGAIRTLSTAGDVRTDVLQLRVVGIPPELAPIDVIEVELAGGGATREPVTDSALAASGLVPLALTPPAARPGLALQLTATAATTVTIGPVAVVYAEPSTGGLS